MDSLPLWDPNVNTWWIGMLRIEVANLLLDDLFLSASRKFKLFVSLAICLMPWFLVNDVHLG